MSEFGERSVRYPYLYIGKLAIARVGHQNHVLANGENMASPVTAALALSPDDIKGRTEYRPLVQGSPFIVRYRAATLQEHKMVAIEQHLL